MRPERDVAQFSRGSVVVDHAIGQHGEVVRLGFVVTVVDQVTVEP